MMYFRGANKMGKKSIKPNKNIYQQSREDLDYTRQDVDNLTNGVLSTSRIEKIESGTANAHPEDVLVMAKVYRKPELCNYFCSNECEIGKKYVPAVKTIHDLPQITMTLLSNLNALNKDKDRIIDITADGKVTEDERTDFELIKNHLDEMSLTIETLKLWINKELADPANA
jgi:hypothetical protein